MILQKLFNFFLDTPEEIEILSKNSITKYKKELNWDYWGEQMKNIFTNLE